MGKQHKDKRTFLWLYDTEGGMDHSTWCCNCIDDALFGWKTNPTEDPYENSEFPPEALEEFAKQDAALKAWVETAQVGDYHHHRQGVLVRIKDAA